MNYKGTANLTPEVKSIFAGEADNVTTPPGDLCRLMIFNKSMTYADVDGSYVFYF
jgi:hypothetical protein